MDEGSVVSNGTDIKVVVKGDEQIPVEVKMKKKETEADLKAMHGNDAIIYLGNKNLQSFPRRLRGAIIWLKSSKIVAAVVEASVSQAYVKILHPRKKQGEKIFVENLSVEGCFLQLVLGDCPLPVDYEFRGRKIDPDTGDLVTLVDRNGCIKMNVFGPDIVTLDEARRVPAKHKAKLRMNKLDRLTVLNMEKLAKRPKLEQHGVPVVYVFREVTSDYSFVQRYWHKGTKIDKWSPVFMVPIGEPYSDRTGQSNRYVTSQL
jgi:hypothetical protein